MIGTVQCYECKRVFDIVSSSEDQSEWYAGHDCEVQESTGRRYHSGGGPDCDCPVCVNNREIPSKWGTPPVQSTVPQDFYDNLGGPKASAWKKQKDAGHSGVPSAWKKKRERRSKTDHGGTE